MNNRNFHDSLLRPTRLGNQFEQSSRDDDKNEIDNFFSMNQHEDDDNGKDIDETEQRRKKHKKDILMDETVRKK